MSEFGVFVLVAALGVVTLVTRSVDRQGWRGKAEKGFEGSRIGSMEVHELWH